MANKRKLIVFAAGYGSGYGDGDGDGSGFGSGSGDGSGFGSGSGDGSGSGSGYGDGDGSGSGYGDGDGSGSGSGDGSGSGFGSGSGSDYGFGDGYGSQIRILRHSGQEVYYIDNVPTVIYSVHGDYAKGATIDNDSFSLTPCYIARVNGYYAHGETLRDAVRDATEKFMESRTLDERIADTIAEHPDIDAEIPNRELFSLHHILTGSCEFGRREFARMHGIDIDNGSMTMRGFINLTSSAYGAENIIALKKDYENNH